MLSVGVILCEVARFVIINISLIVVFLCKCGGLVSLIDVVSCFGIVISISWNVFDFSIMWLFFVWVMFKFVICL